ncbi:class I adenylate-forming enzyme family protein [Legionella sp. WA2024007413]
MSQLSTLLGKSAEQFPENIALIVDQRCYSYQQLNELTIPLAASLLKRGISQGERVAFLLPNCIEIILCYYACFSIGAIAVPVNIRFNNELIHYVLEHSNARIFITSPEYYNQLDEKILKVIKECYLTFKSDNYPGVQDFQQLLSSATASPVNMEIGLKKNALLFFTSGTTGLPKAVVHSHQSLYQGTRNQITQIKINHEDKTLVMFPVCYLIGLGSQILPFHAVGATVVLLPEFHPENALAKLQAHQITKIYGFPKLYLELINHVESSDFKINTLNFCFSGGDATPVSLQERFKELFNIEITEGCGMSELQIYAMNPPYGAKKTGSIGFPITNMEICLIDDKNKTIVTPHKIGELIVRGKSMCSGYWQDTTLTAKTIKDGWFHTGDLAYQDKEGYYWFVSRKVDIIRYNEELISPIEIENIFYQLDGVKEAAAIALPNTNKQNKDHIVVYVTFKTKASQLTPQTLMNFAHASLPINKRPYQVIILNQLPYGFTGKIDRNRLRVLAKNQMN